MVENPIISNYVEDVLSKINEEARNQDLKKNKTVALSLNGNYWEGNNN